MKHRQQLKRITRALNAKQPPLPWLSISQSWDDPELFTGADGKTYTAADIPELEKSHNLFVIVYTDEWRPTSKSARSVNLTWGDEAVLATVNVDMDRL
jgi:hypothetical protein